MKTIILTVAVAVLGLTSCTKVQPVLNSTEIIQGEWSNNSVWVTTPTESFEPAVWLNVTIEGNTWTYENSEPVTFQIEGNIIYFSNGGENHIEYLTDEILILTNCLSNGNTHKVVFNRN